ncbi:MAG: response regulator [Methanobacteriaceae archaeon]|nr:response regulator [Methanobacteriaceae archaeon]
MIAEDDAIIAMGLENKITSWGYSVESVVYRGEDAVEASFKSKPDLILMDIGLKGELDGIEAAKRIKSLDIPVIFVTGQNDQGLIKDALKTVPYAILKKPLLHEILKEKMQTALKRGPYEL